MLKILKAIAFGGYCALFLYLIKSVFLDNDEQIELNYILRTPGTLKKMMKELKNMKKNLSTFKSNFQRPKRLSTDFKYILKWTQAFSHFDSPIYRNGQKAFLDFNCTYKNCYMTNDRSALVDIRHFDAIIVDVENTWDSYPPLKIPHQLNIFTATESAVYDPVCDDNFDNFFHLTWTYKLDSNIPSPFIAILDKNENVIGPKTNMTWAKMEPTTEDVIKKLKDKNKVVAWFVSDCHLVDRGYVVKNLIKSLAKVNLKLDIYGACGNITCPRNRMEECFGLLQKNYYFYLAFENSVAEDYVTEQLLYPLLHYTVPIVFGGANYSRFLPPGAYIDAGKCSSDEVVDLMLKAIQTPSIYHNYFRWHQHYVYREAAQGAGVCSLCQTLNSQHNFTPLHNFRSWWNPNYENIQDTDYNEAAEKAKSCKYRGLGSECVFVPFGVETLGPWGPSAISLFKEIAKRLLDFIGDRRAGSYLGQRIILAIQRGNAVSIFGTLPKGTPFNNIF